MSLAQDHKTCKCRVGTLLISKPVSFPLYAVCEKSLLSWGFIFSPLMSSFPLIYSEPNYTETIT